MFLRIAGRKFKIHVRLVCAQDNDNMKIPKYQNIKMKLPNSPAVGANFRSGR